ncbi:hypothetical protein TNCV_1414761 [Trichonephila clavipes]|nr:hypothetical protein TNCV_1414761 [Trichonephila clavipes]
MVRKKKRDLNIGKNAVFTAERYLCLCCRGLTVCLKLLGSVVPARISSQSSRHCWRSPLSHASALTQRDFGCVLGVQQTKQPPHVVKVDLV